MRYQNQKINRFFLGVIYGGLYVRFTQIGRESAVIRCKYIVKSLHAVIADLIRHCEGDFSESPESLK